MNLSRSTILLVAALVALPAAAAGGGGGADVPETLDLAHAQQLALENAPRLRAAEAHATAAAEEARAARGRRWGRLDLVASAARLNDDTILRPMSRELFEEAGPAGFHGLPFDRNQRRWGATLEIPLWTGGRLARRIRAADLGAVAARSLATGTRWQLRANVASLYGAVVSLDGLDEALAGFAKTLEKTRARLRLMVEQGKRPRVDLLKVEEELAAVDGRRAEVRARRQRAWGLLAALLGVDPAREVHLSPPTESEARRLLELDLPSRRELEEAALAASGVRAAAANAGRAEALERAARAELLPTLAAQGTYLQNDAPSVGDPLDTWQVALALRVPVWHGGELRARTRAARARRVAARAEKERARRAARARLAASLAGLDAARARLAAARARVAAAGEAARIERLRYENGASTVEDLLRAEAREAEARADLVAARAGLRTAIEELAATCEKELVPGAAAPATEEGR